VKKFLTSLILSIFLFVSSPCLALSELYYIKNATKSAMDNKMEALLKENNYSLNKKSPFFAVQTKDTSNYAIVVFQQSGKNLFYYYTSNNNDKKVNKAFLRDLKSQGIIYEQSKNEDLINNFENIAQKTLHGTQTTYTFDEIDYPTLASAINSSQKQNDSWSGYVAMVGKDSRLDAYLQNPINTATAKEGDVVNAILKSNWIINNKVIASKGSLISGTLTKADAASIGMRNGKVSISFNKITTPNNVTYDISTQKIDFNVSNEGVVKKTVSTALAAAAVGALLGVAIGALSNDVGSGIAKGAMIGAGVGAGGALITKGLEPGVDAEIPSYTDIEIIIDKDIRVVFND